MFTTPTASAPTISTTTSPASPTTPLRSGRLRGLSYLRSYTLNHLHSHSSNHSTSDNTSRPTLSRARSQPANTTAPPSNNTHLGSSTVYAFPTPSLPALSNETSATSNSRFPLNNTAAAGSTVNSISTAAPGASLTMTRNRADTAAPTLEMRGQTSTSTAGDGNSDGNPHRSQLPSIRFIPHQDPRSTRPSLSFPAITRTLPNEGAVIRVGRYSERDNQQEIPSNVPSAAPVGFKSKVVSRRHCEFWCQNSQWYIKDVKSSSGTFLNHIRLSQPGVESAPYPIRDGDVVQLGIDFRGGEEMIFRCVKIRIEVNRGWQKGLNNFNKTTHQRLRNLAKSSAKKDSDSASTHTSECSICLMSVAPCQSLFVAPCSHVWHYKCIRPILNGSTYPNFLCPNCRAVADLEAEIDDPNEYEDWEDALEETIEESKRNAYPNGQTNGGNDRHLTPQPSQAQLAIAQLATGSSNTSEPNNISLSDLAAAMNSVLLDDPPVTTEAQIPQVCTPPLSTRPLPSQSQSQSVAASSSSSTQPILITTAASSRSGTTLPPTTPFSNSTLPPSTPSSTTHYTLSPDGVPHPPECPMTPRNDAGPFVLDGSAGRAAGRALQRQIEGSA